MSLDTSVTLDFGDGTYLFRLGVKEIEELETKREAGILKLFRRMNSDDWRIGDLQEVIRLGLIGGGMDSVAALRFTRKYVVPPLLPLREPVLKILYPVIVSPDPDLGKSPAGETAKETEQPNGSSLPQHTH